MQGGAAAAALAGHVATPMRHSALLPPPPDESYNTCEAFEAPSRAIAARVGQLVSACLDWHQCRSPLAQKTLLLCSSRLIRSPDCVVSQMVPRGTVRRRQLEGVHGLVPPCPPFPLSVRSTPSTAAPIRRLTARGKTMGDLAT